MHPIKKRITKPMIIVTCILLILLPLVSVILTLLFHDDVVLDKPKIVEESIKSIVSLIISTTGILSIDLINQLNYHRKSKAFRAIVMVQVHSMHNPYNNLLKFPDLLEYEILAKSQISTIKQYEENKTNIMHLLKIINTDLVNIQNYYFQSESEVINDSLDLLKEINDCLFLIQSYFSYQTPSTFIEIKENLRKIIF